MCASQGPSRRTLWHNGLVSGLWWHTGRISRRHRTSISPREAILGIQRRLQWLYSPNVLLMPPDAATHSLSQSHCRSVAAHAHGAYIHNECQPPDVPSRIVSRVLRPISYWIKHQC